MDRLKNEFELLQDPDEFTAFCEILAKEGVQSYLEIGSWSGGSIEMVAKYLPKGSRIVSVDLPFNIIKHMRLKRILDGLHQEGYSTHLCSGDSMDGKFIRMAETFGPYDAVFIDGGHTFECVKSDWENYGRRAKIVGFHDIAIDSAGHGVAKFWKQLKTKHRHIEFISEETRRQFEGYGIGVIWN